MQNYADQFVNCVDNDGFLQKNYQGERGQPLDIFKSLTTYCSQVLKSNYLAKTCCALQQVDSKETWYKMRTLYMPFAEFWSKQFPENFEIMIDITEKYFRDYH